HAVGLPSLPKLFHVSIRPIGPGDLIDFTDAVRRHFDEHAGGIEIGCASDFGKILASAVGLADLIHGLLAFTTNTDVQFWALTQAILGQSGNMLASCDEESVREFAPNRLDDGPCDGPLT